MIAAIEMFAPHWPLTHSLSGLPQDRIHLIIRSAVCDSHHGLNYIKPYVWDWRRKKHREIGRSVFWSKSKMSPAWCLPAHMLDRRFNIRSTYLLTGKGMYNNRTNSYSTQHKGVSDLVGISWILFGQGLLALRGSAPCDRLPICHSMR